MKEFTALQCIPALLCILKQKIGQNGVFYTKENMVIDSIIPSRRCLCEWRDCL